MTTELIVVGARLNSSRLPQKHLLPLAGVPLIEQVFKRLQACKRKPLLVLATTADDYNQPLISWAREFGVEVFAYQGDVNDLVARVDAVVEHYQPERIVYVCGDCPLVDSDFTDSLLQTFSAHKDWEGVTIDPSIHHHLIHEGILPFSYAGWKKVVRHSVTPLHREHVALAVAGSDILNVGPITVDERYCFKHRISVDTVADYQFMDQVYQRWYASNPVDSLVDLLWLKAELAAGPALKNINQHVMQKSGYKKYGKVVFVCEASSQKGLGQLTRTLSIAQRLQEETGLGTEILVLGDKLDLPSLRFNHVSWFSCESALCEQLGNVDVSAVIVDVFPQRLIQPQQWQHVLTALKASNIKLLGLDQLYQWPQYFDAIIVPTLAYGGQKSPHIYAGPEYIFTQPRLTNHARIESNNLLVLTGGSDAFHYGQFLPCLLDEQLTAGTTVVWVQGPYAQGPKLPEQPRLHWQLIQAPDTLQPLIEQCDAAISVYGASFFELLAAQVPSAVLLPEGMVSQAEIDVVVNNNLALLMSGEQDFSQIKTLLLESSVRKNIVAAMAGFTIGGGVKRTVDIVADLLDQH